MPGGSDVIVQVLDGRDTIGGSKILVGWGGEGVFLDFGINYGHWGRYFEEYIKPRPAYGLADLWKLGMVPRLQGLYRPDVVPPLLQRGTDLPVKKIRGVYVSHAHLDHAGLIGLLEPSIPIVCSRMTAAILKSVQDSQAASIFQQSVYASPLKRDTIAGQEVIRSDEDAPWVGRDVFLTDGSGSDGFHRFWGDPPNRPHLSKAKGKKPRELNAGLIRTLQPSSGGVEAEPKVVDHSVLGSNAFVIETPQGPIAYSGDLRATGAHAESSKAFLNQLERRPPWILLMEGTQVREEHLKDEGFAAPTTEADVEAKCIQVVDEYRGRMVLADFGPRNIERLQAFLRIAKRTGRRLVITPKDAYLLHGMNTADPTVPVPSDELLVFDPPASTVPAGWERYLFSLYQPYVIHHHQVRQRQGEIILCFSFFDMKHLLDVMPDGGCYIYSSSEFHSEEAEIDMERLYNWLSYYKLDSVGFRMVPTEGKRRRLRAEGVKGFHASGHMAGDQILGAVERIRPEFLIPIHTEGRDVFRRRFEGTGIRIVDGAPP